MICKFYMKGNCKKNNCKFIHSDTYKYTKNNNSKNYNFKPSFKKKNTQSFTPLNTPSDMVVKFYENSNLKENDVIYFPNFFNDISIYNKLLEEVKLCNINNIWKLWHGDSHHIADDKLGNWKSKCPTLMYIINEMANYYKMDVKATRFNHYRDNKSWKPYHRDAAAVKKDKMKTQNFTLGVSFGNKRTISFQHFKTKTRVDFPLEDGTVYGFCKKVNIDWMHGIPQKLEGSDSGRISIILWGKI